VIVPVTLGQHGFLSVRYTGDLRGAFCGVVTGHRYRVHPAERQWQYVDVRDAPGLMSLVGTNGLPLFRPA